jgi:predicted branched-subunit amino acid permease
VTAATPQAWSKTRREVLRDALGVGVAVGAYGVSFGAIGRTSGLNVAQTCALSVLTFTGASQFALVGVLGAGGSAISGVATAWLLGARNTLYGLRLAPTLALRGLQKLIGSQLVIDESSAMAFGQTDRRAARLAFWATGLAVFVCWNVATLVGAFGAGALGDPAALGLDAAVPAAFLALVWPRLRGRSALMVAALGAVAALLLVPVVPVGFPVLVAGLVAAVAGLAGVRAREFT